MSEPILPNGEINGKSVDQLYPEAKRLVEALARIHGRVRVARESHGLHAYMPSPFQLQKDGRKELIGMHLAVNLDRHFGRGKFVQIASTYDRDLVGRCMKSATPYRVSELLAMKTLAERGIPNVKSGVFVASLDNEKKLMVDSLGRKVPAPPGDVVSLLDLPPDHPAVDYLVSRGFDLNVLRTMFDISFCVRELPVGVYDRYYRKGPDGWMDTPQNRIILWALSQGSRVGWQARVLQKKSGEWNYFLHPYRGDWVPVEFTPPTIPGQPDQPKQVRADYGDNWKQISKYRSADAMARNEVVFGFDAAVAWNRQMQALNPHWRPIVYVCEGPLDAGRVGPGAVGLTGKYISESQIRMLAMMFRRAVSIMDNDKGGAEAETYFRQAATSMEIHVERPPAHRKDIGEASPGEIQTIRQKYEAV